MALTLNPLKMVSNLFKAHLSNITTSLGTPFRMFKDLLEGKPLEALKEPFNTVSNNFKNLGTILSSGVYTPDQARGAAKVE
ncbi:MAG: hypothetical protein JNK82_39955 [Myxococcaceae bacterium]|nr:hypothetical protein [Myxococcaceae bacterium]